MDSKKKENVNSNENDSLRLCLDPGFGEKKRNENEKIRRSNRSEPLDYLPSPSPSPSPFSSPNSESKYNLRSSILHLLVTKNLLLPEINSKYKIGQSYCHHLMWDLVVPCSRSQKFMNLQMGLS